MTFLFHQSLAICYLALTAGSALYIWAARNEGPGALFAKYASVTIYILTLLSIVHVLFNGGRHWDGVTFSEPWQIAVTPTTGQQSN
ncbi:MAG: hypothetical protein ACD_16C00039G0005 [uncultured bacterium]|nr:MAG: hypothetical protein ACD_16C00039G0005 [uncultured bacterium]OFW69316.1 MAG: hypothetical protein A2X70_03830 [Alphaproteobacteria bacterium GWC2_42_16]OFW74034.1 MAG: hypothetical protein A2Z80_03305 [Alphaproteobacteria bacterium GWA2_41_27]OFW83003.1 MAG: hypothetical protein A3E50_00400 [Alphaproteobacteria bacterium RIFCSPHIGHO2_12_FULL_42_100]OFW84504.1 MAG: hypothetical protein A2W06_05590 [Alphaproteobacteria bacterium RBG_16_42_14]OFW90733.1 MAG: hypothetical protein A2W46_074